MGVTRFLLAAVVVLFHTTNLNWIPGRMAVHGFFVLSGFVITRTIWRNYSDGKAAPLRVYVNRLLRLGPPYIVVLVGSAGLIALTHSALHLQLSALHPYFFDSFDSGTRSKLVSSLSFGDLRPRELTASGLPVLYFAPYAIPQAWSLGVECVFYLIAPLTALIATRRGMRGGAWIVALFAVPWVVGVAWGARSVDLVLYRNVLTTFVLFAIGALSASTSIRFSVAPWIGLVVGVAFSAALVLETAFGPSNNVEPSRGLFVAWQGVTVAAMLVVTHAAPWPTASFMRTLDRRVGDLSYGVYVSHGFTILLLPILSWLVTPRSWTEAHRLSLFAGSPYTARYGGTILLVTVLLAWALWRLVELPVTSLRARVRHNALLVDEPGAVSQATPGVQPPTDADAGEPQASQATQDTLAR